MQTRNDSETIAFLLAQVGRERLAQVVGYVRRHPGCTAPAAAASLRVPVDGIRKAARVAEFYGDVVRETLSSRAADGSLMRFYPAGNADDTEQPREPHPWNPWPVTPMARCHTTTGP